MKNQNVRDRIEALKKARRLLDEAITEIRFAVRGTGIEGRAKSYCISSLEKVASNNSQWLGKNPSNIDSMIEELKNPELA